MLRHSAVPQQGAWSERKMLSASTSTSWRFMPTLAW